MIKVKISGEKDPFLMDAPSYEKFLQQKAVSISLNIVGEALASRTLLISGG